MLSIILIGILVVFVGLEILSLVFPIMKETLAPTPMAAAGIAALVVTSIVTLFLAVIGMLDDLGIIKPPSYRS